MGSGHRCDIDGGGTVGVRRGCSAAPGDYSNIRSLHKPDKVGQQRQTDHRSHLATLASPRARPGRSSDAAVAARARRGARPPWRLTPTLTPTMHARTHRRPERPRRRRASSQAPTDESPQRPSCAMRQVPKAARSSRNWGPSSSLQRCGTPPQGVAKASSTLARARARTKAPRRIAEAATA